MLHKTMIALFAIASVGVLAPNAASARGGHGHGGGGSFHGSVGGAGVRSAAIGGGGSFRSTAIGAGVPAVGGGAFRSGNFAASGIRAGTFRHGFHHRRAFVFGAFAGAYPYYDDYYPSYLYDDSYYDDGCYIVRQRVHTRYGWRIRPVQVCG
jgi:hypothetical protein